MFWKASGARLPQQKPLRTRADDYVILGGIVLAVLMLATLLWFLPITGTNPLIGR